MPPVGISYVPARGMVSTPPVGSICRPRAADARERPRTYIQSYITDRPGGIPARKFTATEWEYWCLYSMGLFLMLSMYSSVPLVSGRRQFYIKNRQKSSSKTSQNPNKQAISSCTWNYNQDDDFCSTSKNQAVICSCAMVLLS